ncbi:X-pro dipeptidyl-peptidase, S15 family protein (macronuclear) [Tetrahymena thermophila SB210]|uniref:X-pro dipeptidyl-peptidase, S15 family protein n=1 Tax=Tetrahymena thermophila (strain SB210) TaxID=312017 RepID=Q22UT1_TETTS|nr:X-pro dipeptidyl-peptidase, S15 family protein [Tetrahymena thermophila SB210]EAR89045.2 X-pro dipeptidyl-peptidase, S15 family protein [Tetrahymena thermophila SB210]|eukprot:XP_001009290.2 X-pro dipeptidyl-peptidase, S15 family protein [Tetrahymena thermophila SB210]
MLPSALKQESGPTSVLNEPQKGISLVQQQNQAPNKAACQSANGQPNPKELEKDTKQVKKQKQPGYIEQLWRALIRPPNRINYKPQQLGPVSFVLDKTVIVKREDFKVKNSRGFNLECSYFEPISLSGKPHPCVLYLHGNSSSRNEGIVLVQYLLPYGISLVLMDFSGCGISEGEFISLGYYEKYDAKQVMEHVKKWKPITEFGLWGRSMGAATTLMTSLNEDLSIRFIVIDSSFLSIKQLCEEIATNQYKVPKFILNWAYQYIRRKIKNLANFDLDDCDALKAVQNQKSKPCALFLVAKADTLISPSHSQKLYNLYRGPKRLLMFEGTHNSRRPKEINQEITKFFYNGFFDEYAKKQFNVFKLVPQLPNFNKTEAQSNPNQNGIQKNVVSIAPVAAPNSVVSMQNNPSTKQINGNSISNPSQKEDNLGKSDSNNQNATAVSLQNRTKYISTGQLQSKNVEKEEVQEEDEGEMNSMQKSEQIKINPTNNNYNNNNNILNHISLNAQPPKFHKERFSPKSIVPEPSIQNDTTQYDFHNQNNTKFKLDSFYKMNPSELQLDNGNQLKIGKENSSFSNIKTINHNYNNNNNNVYPLSMVQNTIQQGSNSIIQINEDGNNSQEKSVDRNNKNQKSQIQFSNFRHIQQMKNQNEETFMKEESKLEQQEQEGVMSEESKVYSVNMPNAQVNLNTEGVEQSPKPKSQYNFDSNNILINFQRYNNNNTNNAINSNNNIGSNNGLQIINNGSIIQHHINKNQDIKEEEDTQFNSKIDKLDQENVNQNIGLSGFYLPPEYSQIHNSGVQQNNQANSNRFPSPNIQNMQNFSQNERLQQNLFFHTNSIISGNTPNQHLDNKNNLANTPDRNTSPFQFQDHRAIQNIQIKKDQQLGQVGTQYDAQGNLIQDQNQQQQKQQNQVFQIQQIIQF